MKISAGLGDKVGKEGEPVVNSVKGQHTASKGARALKTHIVVAFRFIYSQCQFLSLLPSHYSVCSIPF